MFGESFRFRYYKKDDYQRKEENRCSNSFTLPIFFFSHFSFSSFAFLSPETESGSTFCFHVSCFWLMLLCSFFLLCELKEGGKIKRSKKSFSLFGLMIFSIHRYRLMRKAVERKIIKTKKKTKKRAQKTKIEMETRKGIYFLICLFEGRKLVGSKCTVARKRLQEWRTKGNEMIKRK